MAEIYIQHRKQRLGELQKPYDSLSEKIGKLWDTYAYEVDPAVKFQREKQIREAEKEREQIQRERESIEQEIEAFENEVNRSKAFVNAELTLEFDINKLNETEREGFITMLANMLDLSPYFVRISLEVSNFIEYVRGGFKMAIKLPQDKAIELKTQFNEQSKAVQQLQSAFALQNVDVQKFDLLVIDDSEGWRDVIVETFDSVYSCDVASTYEEAVKKINAHNYKVVSLSEPFHTIHEWRKLLQILKRKAPETPVIMVSNDPIEEVKNIQKRYSNVKEIIFKGEQPDGSNFVATILDKLPSLIHN